MSIVMRNPFVYRPDETSSFRYLRLSTEFHGSDARIEDTRLVNSSEIEGHIQIRMWEITIKG